MRIEQKLLTINKYSRPGSKLKKVKGVVIHWVANPNSTALANRNFFENRKNGKSGYGSAHYIIGLQGEIIQCIPDNEVAYHVGSKIYSPDALKRLSSYPNDCTIGIECCHIDWSGKMTNETYNTLVELSTFLLKKYGLTEKDLWLHKEVVLWKDCHKWFVDNPHEWIKFKELVGSRLRQEQKIEKELVKLSKYFKDLQQKHAWAEKDVDLAYELKLVVGDGNGNLRPDEPLTRLEGVVLLMRLYRLLKGSDK